MPVFLRIVAKAEGAEGEEGPQRMIWVDVKESGLVRLDSSQIHWQWRGGRVSSSRPPLVVRGVAGDLSWSRWTLGGASLREPLRSSHCALYAWVRKLRKAEMKSVCHNGYGRRRLLKVMVYLVITEHE